MAKKPLCLAFLWHMHQPEYGDAQTGEVYLPWTRFHAVKDYIDMGALIARAPGLHATVNFAPSLLDQLCSYGQGQARETYIALTLRNAADLEEREKLFLLRAFFQLPWKQMILPYPRYKDLLERRGASNARGEHASGLKRYCTQDFRDLQVWFNLSWCGNELRRDGAIAGLFQKGRNFTEDDKRRLIEHQVGSIGRVVPLYGRLAEQHGVELSVSPYYHPILPLLCDSRAAREVLGEIPLPEHLFSFPGDAVEQIGRAQRRFADVFRRPARGMWPSEGAISDAAAAAVDKAGLRWIASDEGVLFNSLRKSGVPPGDWAVVRKYGAFRWGDSGLAIFFRDRQLSDLVGFTYSQWQAADAVGDFMQRLRSIHASMPDDGRHHVVPIILDGENAWEHYPNNGADFLALLYRQVCESDHLRAVTFSEFLDIEPHREPLPTIAAGSWIYGSLATWIGHTEKNRAWDALGLARHSLHSSQIEGLDPQRLEAALKEMMVAEGSDWFWWYGDDHETQNAAEFDALFRAHLKNVYRLLGKPCPLGLDVAIKKAESRALYRSPLHTLTPRLDGKVTDYFEWLSAGYATPLGGESMHRTQRYLEKVFFGYDADRFYLRIDLTAAARKKFPANGAVELSFTSPSVCRLLLSQDEAHRWRLAEFRCGSPDAAAEFAGDRILEAGIPLRALGITGPEELRLSIAVLDDGREVERFPGTGLLSIPVDPWTLDQDEWMV